MAIFRMLFRSETEPLSSLVVDVGNFRLTPDGRLERVVWTQEGWVTQEAFDKLVEHHCTDPRGAP